MARSRGRSFCGVSRGLIFRGACHSTLFLGTRGQEPRPSRAETKLESRINQNYRALVAPNRALSIESRALTLQIGRTARFE